MSHLRVVLAWLVMAALPLQGLAAASMLFCGIEQASHVSQAAGNGHAGHVHDESPATDEGHRHAMHPHASQDRSHADARADHAVKAGQARQGHSCPVCASCCQVAAVSGFEPLPLADAAPAAGPVQPQVRIATRIPSVPDKPPRA